MKYLKLHLYNWWKYPKTKLTETDLEHIYVLQKFKSPMILGTKEQVKRLKDLTDKFNKWYC